MTFTILFPPKWPWFSFVRSDDGFYIFPPKWPWFTCACSDNIYIHVSRQNDYGSHPYTLTLACTFFPPRWHQSYLHFVTHLVSRHLELENNGCGEVCHVFFSQTCSENWTALCDNITSGVLHCVTRRRRRTFHFGNLFRSKAILAYLSSAIFWRKKNACSIVNNN